MSSVQGGHVCPSLERHTPTTHPPSSLVLPYFSSLLSSLPDMCYVSVFFFYILYPHPPCPPRPHLGGRLRESPTVLCSTSYPQWLEQSLHVTGTQEVSVEGRKGDQQAGCHPVPLLLKDTPKGSSSGLPRILKRSILRLAICLFQEPECVFLLCISPAPAAAAADSAEFSDAA